jgi:hypothetical protein
MGLNRTFELANFKFRFVCIFLIKGGCFSGGVLRGVLKEQGKIAI